MSLTWLCPSLCTGASLLTVISVWLKHSIHWWRRPARCWKAEKEKKIKQIKQENKIWALMEAKKLEVSTSATWRKAEGILITRCARLGNSGAIKSIACNLQQRCYSCCNVFAWFVGYLCRLAILPADFLFPEGLINSLIFPQAPHTLSQAPYVTQHPNFSLFFWAKCGMSAVWC